MIELNRAVHDRQNLEGLRKAAAPIFEGLIAKRLAIYTPLTALVLMICRNWITYGKHLLIVAGIVGLSMSPAKAADANHGADLAKRWCAPCHVVDSGQKQASADVPPFAAVANKPDFSAEKLAFFLLDPHPKMPNFSLSRNEAGDMAAYIGSLRN